MPTVILSGQLGDANQRVGLLGLGWIAAAGGTIWSGAVEADGKASMSSVGRMSMVASMKSQGVDTLQLAVSMTIGGVYEVNGIATVGFRVGQVWGASFEADGVGSMSVDITTISSGSTTILSGWLGDNGQRVGLLGLGYVASAGGGGGSSSIAGQFTAAGKGSMLLHPTMDMLARALVHGIASALFSSVLQHGVVIGLHGVGTMNTATKMTLGGKFECDGAATHITFITFYDGVPVDGIISSLPPAIFAPAGNLFDGSHSY